MAGSGAIGWSHDTGMKVPVHIPLLDNTASFLSGLSHMYERRGRGDVNIVAVAGDGATADCGFQSLSGAAERGEKILYICYDNEGYMNTGYQRSSTTTEGSRTSTTPLGSALCGKQQPQKYIPLILAMHGVEYCATATPWNMRDMVEKIEKGLAGLKARLCLPPRLFALPHGLELRARPDYRGLKTRREEQYVPALGEI